MMQSLKWPTISPVLLAALAACSSGGGSDNTPITPNFTEQEADLDAIRSSFATAGVEFTDLSTLPTTGSATYEGVLALGSELIDVAGPGEFDVAGEMVVNVEFADDSVSGTTSHFRAADNSVVSGELNLDNGFLNRSIVQTDTSGPAIEGELGGTLTFANGTAYEFLGGYGGNVAGQEGEQFIGGAGGTVCAGADCGDFSGDFGVLRTD